MSGKFSGIVWKEIRDSSGVSDFYAEYQGWEAKVYLQANRTWGARIGYHSPAHASHRLEASSPQKAMAEATQWLHLREEKTAKQRARQGKPPKKVLSLEGKKRRAARRIRINKVAIQSGYTAPYPQLLGNVVAEHKVPFVKSS